MNFMKCYVLAIQNLNWEFVGHSPMGPAEIVEYSRDKVKNALDLIVEVSTDVELIEGALYATEFIEDHENVKDILHWFLSSGDAEPEDIDDIISTLSSIEKMQNAKFCKLDQLKISIV